MMLTWFQSRQPIKSKPLQPTTACVDNLTIAEFFSWKELELNKIIKNVAPKLVEQQHVPSKTPIIWAYLTSFNKH